MIKMFKLYKIIFFILCYSIYKNDLYIIVDPFWGEGPGRIAIFPFHYICGRGGPPHAWNQPHGQLAKGMASHEGGWEAMLVDGETGDRVRAVTKGFF